jgi:hypothetical protein
MAADLAATSKRIAELEALVGDHVRTIVGVAMAAPPGGNNEWDRVLAHYGAPQDTAVKRLEDAAQAGQARGATTAELERVLVAMVAQARAELDRIVPPVPIGGGAYVVAVGAGTNDVDFEGRIATLRAHLDRMPKAECGRYVAAVCPPRQAVAASVGSVFANAQSTAKLTPWANVKIDPSRVLGCGQCGAPQEVALDFVCRYCRSPMGKLAK